MGHLVASAVAVSLACLVGSRAVTAQTTVRIVVDPLADESASGGGTIRVADVDTALAKARERRAQEHAGTAQPARIEIVLPPGSIGLGHTLEIDATLSGTPSAPTVLTGVGGKTRLVGARFVPIDFLHDDLTDDVRARLPSDAARAAVRRIDLLEAGVPEPGPIIPRGMGRPTAPAPTELFWNGTPLHLARWPNTGFAPVGSIADPGTIPRHRDDDVPASNRETGPARGGSFVPTDDRVARWAGEVDPWAFGYWRWDWADELLPIAAIDATTHRITLGLPHRYGLHPSGRFRAVNVLAELDEPGEYHLDVAHHVLHVWPPATPTRADEILLSTLADPLLLVHDAHDVVVRDLDLGFTRGPAIQIDGGENVTIEHCTIHATGADGLLAAGRHHRISHCRIEDTGAAGAVLAGGDRATLTPCDIAIEDCEITRFARLERTYRPGVSASGVGIRIAHNSIHDAPHFAIQLAGNENLVEANEIYAVVQETGDAGAIYLGRDWAMHGTVIRDNLIRDLPGTKDRWQNAIYLDDMASGITVTGNVVLRCNLGMLIGGGRSVHVRHNVFVDCTEGLRFDARGTGWMAKAIADPATSTLHRRLRALPIDRPPWSERYPDVARTLTIGFGRPIGSDVVGNAFFHTPLGRIADRDAVRVDGNLELDAALDPRAIPMLSVPGIPDFPPIPIGTVGPRPR